MPDADGHYRTSEKSAYRSPECPECGGRTLQSWIKVSGLAHTEDLWIPGTYSCANPGKHSQG
jgi:hypothetical protein